MSSVLAMKLFSECLGVSLSLVQSFKRLNVGFILKNDFSDPSPVGISGFVVYSSSVPRSVRPSLGVGFIFGRRCKSKISPAVVVSTAIDVVDLVLGPPSSHIEPHESVHVDLMLTELDSYVPQSVGVADNVSNRVMVGPNFENSNYSIVWVVVKMLENFFVRPVWIFSHTPLQNAIIARTPIGCKP